MGVRYPFFLLVTASALYSAPTPWSIVASFAASNKAAPLKEIAKPRCHHDLRTRDSPNAALFMRALRLMPEALHYDMAAPSRSDHGGCLPKGEGITPPQT